MARRQQLQLFVSRLSFYTTEQGLKEMFSPFGAVTEARLIKDGRTGRPKGFGFISYKSADEAQRAINAMNARIVDGHLIFVEFAKSQCLSEGRSDS